MNIAILIAIAFIACAKSTNTKQNEKRTIDVLAVIEETDYAKLWLPMNDENTDMVMSSMSSFYSHLFIGVDKHFKSVSEQTDISVKLRDIHVEYKSNTPLLSFDPNSPKLTLSKTTENLKKFLKDRDYGYKGMNVDVIVIFTSKNVKSGGVISRCNTNFAVIIVQNGDFFSSIDRTVKGLTDKSNKKLKKCLEKIKPSNSKTQNDFYLMDDYNEQVAGQKFPLHDQCRIGFGLDSKPCEEKNNQSQRICQEVYCSSGEQCKMIVPADGTLCGDKKWCMGAACVDSDKAVNKINDCPF